MTGEAATVEIHVDTLFSNLVGDEPDPAVCLSSGDFCLGSPIACCPGLTCRVSQFLMFLECLP